MNIFKMINTMDYNNYNFNKKLCQSVNKIVKKNEYKKDLKILDAIGTGVIDFIFQNPVDVQRCKSNNIAECIKSFKEMNEDVYNFILDFSNNYQKALDDLAEKNQQEVCDINNLDVFIVGSDEMLKRLYFYGFNSKKIFKTLKNENITELRNFPLETSFSPLFVL
jgi:hypothetical protein